VNAVHDTITKHSIETSKCGGTDEHFRNPSVVLSHGCEDHRQAQTCIAVAADIIDTSLYKWRPVKPRVENTQLLRTFGFAEGPDRRPNALYYLDYLDFDFPDLTICQVLRAAMATPGLVRPFATLSGTKTVAMCDASPYAANPVRIALRDYELLYRRPISSVQEHLLLSDSDSGSPTSVKRPTNDGPALFLSIGCYQRGTVYSQRVSMRQIWADQPLILCAGTSSFHN
jgi:hypothetical protein